MAHVLKGKAETNEPTEADLRKELKSLLNGEVEFVMLESRKGFIKSTLVNNKKKEDLGFLSIEVNQSSDMYSYYGKYKFSFEETYEIFKDYLWKGGIELTNGKWVPSGWSMPNNVLNKSNLKKGSPIFLIFYLIVSMTIWVTSKGEAGLWAFLAPLFVLALIITGIITTEFGYARLPSKIISFLSKQIGMPSIFVKSRSLHYKQALHVELKPGSKKNRLKLIFLELIGFLSVVVLGSISLCIWILAVACLILLIFNGPNSLYPIVDFFKNLSQ
jgi:hypothetical protein